MGILQKLVIVTVGKLFRAESFFPIKDLSLSTGRLIAIPINGTRSAGFYELPWLFEMNPGIYFYSLTSPWLNEKGKIILIR